MIRLNDTKLYGYLAEKLNYMLMLSDVFYSNDNGSDDDGDEDDGGGGGYYGAIFVSLIQCLNECNATSTKKIQAFDVVHSLKPEIEKNQNHKLFWEKFAIFVDFINECILHHRQHIIYGWDLRSLAQCDGIHSSM